MPKMPKQQTHNYTSSSDNHYYRWSITAYLLIISIAIVLTWFGNSIFNKTMNALNKSNQKIIEKTGIEVSAELNQKDFLLTSKIIDTKNSLIMPTTNIRNIFLFNSYTNQTPKIIESNNIE